MSSSDHFSFADLAEKIKRVVDQQSASEIFAARIREWDAGWFACSRARREWGERVAEHGKAVYANREFYVPTAEPPRPGWAFAFNYLDEADHAARHSRFHWLPPVLLPDNEPEFIFPFDHDRTTALTLNEKYVILAAIHDHYGPGFQRLNPFDGQDTVHVEKGIATDDPLIVAEFRSGFAFKWFLDDLKNKPPEHPQHWLAILEGEVVPDIENIKVTMDQSSNVNSSAAVGPVSIIEHVRYIETVRDEVHFAADCKRNMLERGYGNDTISQTIRGIKWSEAKERAEQITELPLAIVEKVIRVLRRELSSGTIEQIDNLLTPTVHELRDALENAREDGQTSNATNGDAKKNLADLQPADRKAYFSFLYAEAKKNVRLEDREAYEYLKTEGISIEGHELGELSDYVLPTFATWAKQLRGLSGFLCQRVWVRYLLRAPGIRSS